jgi:hypothetical protein
VPDLAVFLIAVFVLCAPAVGAGLETLSRGAERLGVVRAAAGLVAAVSLPAVVIAANYRVNDHHRRTYEIEYFDAFFGELPARAAIVSEEYAVDQMMHYKLAGEGAAGERDIRVVNRDRQGLSDLASRGYALYAFGKAQKELAPFGFDFTPVALGSPNRSIDMRPLPLFLLRAITPCADIGNLGWTDITPTAHAGRGRLVVRIDNYRQFEAEVLVYALTPTRAAVRMLAPTGGRPSFDARVFAPDAGAERQAMARILQADGVALSGAEGRFVSRTLVRVNDMGQAATFMLDLGAHPATVMTRARVDLDNPRRASVCPDALSGAEFFRDPGETRRTVPLGPQGRAYLVAGWHEPERPSEYFRWTSAPDATLLVPLVDPEEIRVVLEAAPFDYPGRPRDAGIALSVNGHLLPRHPLPPGRQPYTWIVPARAWMTGLNEVVIRGPQGRTPAGSGVNEDTRELGLAVYSIVLATTGS